MKIFLLTLLSSFLFSSCTQTQRRRGPNFAGIEAEEVIAEKEEVRPAVKKKNEDPELQPVQEVGTPKSEADSVIIETDLQPSSDLQPKLNEDTPSTEKISKDLKASKKENEPIDCKKLPDHKDCKKEEMKGELILIQPE